MHPFRVIWIAALTLTVLAGLVRASVVISEVGLGVPGSADAYIELSFNAGQKPFDLVVLDANPSRNNRIQTVITITPQPNQIVLLLHEGLWAEPLPATTQQMTLTDDGLKLGAQLSAFARRLVVFSGTTGLRSGVTLASPDQWAIDDLLTYATPDWPVDSALDETVWSVSSGDVLWRRVDAQDNYTDQFLIGSVDEQGYFTDYGSIAPDPGLRNQPLILIAAASPPSHNPEPASAALLAVSAAALLLRRLPTRAASRRW